MKPHLQIGVLASMIAGCQSSPSGEDSSAPTEESGHTGGDSGGGDTTAPPDSGLPCEDTDWPDWEPPFPELNVPLTGEAWTAPGFAEWGTGVDFDGYDYDCTGAVRGTVAYPEGMWLYPRYDEPDLQCGAVTLRHFAAYRRVDDPGSPDGFSYQFDEWAGWVDTRGVITVDMPYSWYMSDQEESDRFSFVAQCAHQYCIWLLEHPDAPFP